MPRGARSSRSSRWPSRAASSARVFASATLGIVACAAALVACIGDDDFLPRYGDATKLGGINGDPLTTDAATVSNATASSTTSVTVPGCTAGQTPAKYVPQTTPCSVTWSGTIEGYIKSSTAWDCANTGCHGGTTQPPITGVATTDYNTLVGYTSTGLASQHVYINPCTTDPDLSSIQCNVTTTGTSCDNQSSMPLNTGANHSPVTAAEYKDLITWLSCGAPNN